MENSKKKYEGFSLANEADLVITDDKSSCDSEKIEASVMKFLKSAFVLGDGSYLGYQLSFDKKGRPTEMAFSSPDTPISMEDYNWIFNGWRKATPAKEGGNFKLHNGMKHYLIGTDLELVNKNKKAEDIPFGSRNVFWFYDNRKNMLEKMKYNYLNLKNAMISSGAVMSVLIGSTDSLESGAGNIIFSFKDDVSISIRAKIALAYPEMKIIEIDSEEMLSKYKIPIYVLGNSLICQLQSFSKKERNDRKGNIAKKEFYIPGDEDPYNGFPFDDSFEECPVCDDIFGEDVQDNKKSYSDRLNELIGLPEVKKHVKDIVAFAKMKNQMRIMKKKSEIPLALNMGFVGNPGTAKTTVARILAGLLYEVGLLESKEILEVGRADLVAIYEGQTADNVKNVFRKARGRLLFIDEAYSLLEYWEGAYGDEAINTIVQEMENHRDRTVVVFAGYPNEMEKFFDRNPGLRSRVPFIINFDDYSPDELIGITELEAAKRGFSINKKAKEKLKSLYSLDNEKISGNGRYCRNVVEQAILSYASRIFDSEGEGKVHNFILTDKDIVLEPKKEKPKIKNVIGFTA